MDTMQQSMVDRLKVAGSHVLPDHIVANLYGRSRNYNGERSDDSTLYDATKSAEVILSCDFGTPGVFWSMRL